MTNVAKHERVAVDPVENEVAVRPSDFDVGARLISFGTDARKRTELRNGCLDRGTNGRSRGGIVVGDVSENIVSLGESRGRIQHSNAP